jgi:hypothetical protein
MTGRPTFLLLFGVFYSLVVPAFADYTLLLKNGRRITVQSYREEGGTIKFPGLGGEIGIGKDQIQAIRKAGENEKPTLNLTQPEPPTSVPTKETPVEKKNAAPQSSEQKTADTENSLAQQRAKEQKALEVKLKDITDQLRQLNERYAAQTTGVTGPEPGFFTTEEAFRNHQEDLLSRLRDAQYRAQGLAMGQNAATPPPVLDAPPAYTQKQKELSDLRNQINQLENQRKSLIDEMREKGFVTGSLFLE